VSGPFYLLFPRIWSVRNRANASDGRSAVRGAVMAVLGGVFWAGTFFLFYKALSYFRSTEVIGDLLARRLLEMSFVTFLSVLIFSSVVTSLSTFYLSEEMQLILSSPASRVQVYVYKYVETLTVSTWMVAVFGLPVLLSYGMVYHAGIFYYLSASAVFAAFILIPAPIGMMAAMVLVRTFPAKRAKDILFFLSIALVVMLYFLIRFLQPEKLMDPEGFGEMSKYIASLSGPSTPFLPSRWAVEAIWPVVSGGASDPFWILMLLSTAAAMFVIGGWVFDAVYMSGYSRAQEGGRYRTYGLTPSGKFLDRLAGRVESPLKALLVKDAKTFFRDTAQWSQLFLLGSLVVVYIYNFKVLPLDRFPFATFFLQNFIAFLNLALAGFVLAAVGVRFVYPMVSLEGGALWILRASPLSIKGFLWAKFWSAWVPLVVLAESLVVLSNYFLNTGPFMMALSTVAILFISFGITGLGVGLGAMYPRFKFENAAQVSAGFGGVVYMLVSTGFVAAVVALLAWPVYLYFTSEYSSVPQTMAEKILSVMSLLAAAAVNVAACVVPMKRGLRSLDEAETG